MTAKLAGREGSGEILADRVIRAVKNRIRGGTIWCRYRWAGTGNPRPEIDTARMAGCRSVVDGCDARKVYPEF